MGLFSNLFKRAGGEGSEGESDTAATTQAGAEVVGEEQSGVAVATPDQGTPADQSAQPAAPGATVSEATPQVAPTASESKASQPSVQRARPGPVRASSKKPSASLEPLEISDFELPSKTRSKTQRTKSSPPAGDAAAPPPPARRRSRRPPPIAPSAAGAPSPPVIPPPPILPPLAPPPMAAPAPAAAAPNSPAPAPAVQKPPVPRPPPPSATTPKPPGVAQTAPQPPPPAPAAVRPPLVSSLEVPLPPLPPPPLPEPPGAAGAAATAAIPTPPPKSDTNPDDLFDIAGELDRWFETSRRRTSRPPPSHRSDRVTTNEDMNSVRDLFNDMAVHYVGQVRDFMLELRRADASTTWIPLCEPAVQKLRSMCDTLAMPDLSRALDEFAAALERAKSSPRGMVQGPRRDELLQAYDQMIALLPRAFELGTGREAIIVQLLLMRVPGVRGLTLEKLYRAGLHEFDSFLRASPAELAAVAGIDVTLAKRIIQRFREYRQNVTAVLAEPAPAQERSRVAALTEQLRQQHDAFERAAAEWSGDARTAKRKLRQERMQTLAEIYVALARLGEVELVATLQKMSVGRQLEEVEEYLRQFRGSAGAL